MIKCDELLMMKYYLEKDKLNKIICHCELDTPFKRKIYLLKKWSYYDYIDYGTSLNYVWLTDYGRMFFNEKVKSL